MKKLYIILILLISVPLGAETLDDRDRDDDFFNFPFGGEKKEGSEIEKLSRDNETETLLGSDLRVTGFGGPMMSYGKLKGQSMFMMGGRGAAVFNDTFIFGGGGAGTVNDLDTADLFASSSYEAFSMGYGGLLVGFSLFSKSIINFSVTSIIGAGSVDYTYVESEGDAQRGTLSESSTSKYEEFFIAEPALMVHLNVSRWMRIGGGVSYRYTKGINVGDLSDQDFRDYSIVMVVDFGWF